MVNDSFGLTTSGLIPSGLTTGYWLLITDNWILATDYWLLTTDY